MNPSTAALLSDIVGTVEAGDMRMLLDIVINKADYIIGEGERAELADSLLQLVRQAGQQEARRQRALALLTARERDVATLLECGLSNGAIARALLVTERTVRAHIEAMHRKLYVTNRTALLCVLLGRMP